ncbi:MAG: Ig-like domain-containing protein [Pyrinomonadaceae bacterium]
MNQVKTLLLFVFAFAFIGFAASEARASHFRYGNVSSRPILDGVGNPTGTVEFKIREGWRRSAFGSAVTGNVVNTGQTFNFGDGSGVSDILTVTSYSATEDWFVGEMTVTHHYIGVGPYTAFQSSCCRIGNLNNGSGGNFRYETIVRPYSLNSSPTTALPPIINLPVSAASTFTVVGSDIDGDTLRYRLATSAENGITQPPGLAINSATGIVTWNTIGRNTTSFWSAQIIIEDLDTSNNVKSKTPIDVLIKLVNAVGTAPQCRINGLTTTYSTSVSPGTPVSFTVTGFDADIDPGSGIANTPVTLNVSGLPVGATMTPSLIFTGPSPVNSTFTWTPTAANGGTNSISYSCTDNAGQQTLNTASIFVQTNTAPVAVNDAYNTNEDTALNVPAPGVLGNDTDADNNSLTATLVSGPSNASSFTLNANGSFSYTPAANFNGIDSFTYKANDGTVDSGVATVNITVDAVNDPPVLTGVPASATIDEMVAYGFTAGATDVDLPAQTLTFSLVGAPSGASINPSTGAFSWTPSETQGPGNYLFSVRVSDGSANTDASVNITVNEVNVAPQIANVPASATIDELVLYSFTATASDADVPAQTLTFSLVGAPSGAGINPSSGAFSWTPTEAQGNGGTYNFTVRVSDGVVNTDAPVSLTVNEVNSAPVLASISDQTVDELTLLSVAASGSDGDIPANTLTFSLDSAPAGMTINPATGAISWTQTEAQGSGDYPVTVRSTDNGTPNLFDTKTFNVHVNEVNLAPELASIGNSTIDEQVAFGFNASATDADLPANTLSFNLVGAPSGASITSNGAFSWTPTEAQGPGSYTFTVRVTDNGTPALSDDEMITLTVREVNRPPVLNSISNQTGVWGNVFSFTATATDPDIPANTLTYSLIGPPLGATINSATGAFSWTPTSGQLGASTFTVRVTDNGTPALHDERSVTVTVGRRPTTLVYGGDGSEQYSDQQALTATLTDTLTGTPISSETIGFAIGTQNTSALTNGSGVASTNLILTQDPALVYIVASTFTGDSLYLPASDSDPFDITQEDARAYYTGSLFLNTSCATCSTGTATLAATVKDITAETSDLAYDVFAGDIRNSTVTFVDRDNSNAPIAGCANLPVGLVNGSDIKIGTATCNWNVNIGSASSTSFSIGIIVSNYYTRNSSGENSVVTVSKPIGTNFITGGGYLVNALSNGQYAGLTGLKTNFGFNVKYNKAGTNLQGNVNVIVRGDGGRVYQIKGNVMRTLAVTQVSASPLVMAAVYTGKANITDITDPLNTISFGGNATFQMNLTDRGEPGSADAIGITLWNDAGGLLFTSRWDGTRTIEQILQGGNLVVH